MSKLEAPVFDGKDDAYWWVICMEEYFIARGTLEEEKMTEAVKAMRGESLKWWLWWGRRHPQVSWETFSFAFIWRFKSDYRDILPITDEEEEPESEPMGQGSFDQVKFEKENEGIIGTIAEPEKHSEEGLKAVRELSRAGENLGTIDVEEAEAEAEKGEKRKEEFPLSDKKNQADVVDTPPQPSPDLNAFVYGVACLTKRPPDPPEPPDQEGVLSWLWATGIRDTVAVDPNITDGVFGAAITKWDWPALRLLPLVRDAIAATMVGKIEGVLPSQKSCSLMKIEEGALPSQESCAMLKLGEGSEWKPGQCSDLMGQAQLKFYSGPFTHQGLPLIQNNVSNQLLPIFQISSQTVNDPAVSHSSPKEPSHPLDVTPKCEAQSQPYITSSICVLRFNWLASSHVFSTPYDESIKVWSKFHLQLMLQRPFHAFATHFYFLIQLSHSFCSLGQLNSPFTMGNLCATLHAPVFRATKEKSDENYWVMGLDPNKLVCVVCKKPEAFPQVVPKPILNAPIYDACFSVVTRIILQELPCVEIHALAGKAMEGSMLTVVEVIPNSVTNQVFSPRFEAIVVPYLLIAFYQLRNKLQPYTLGEKVKQQPLVPSSIYVWFLLHKHMSNSLSSSCNNPKQNSLANEKIWCLHPTVLIRQWDPGESNIPMKVVAYEHCWSSLPTFHGVPHFVFDRTLLIK